MLLINQNCLIFFNVFLDSTQESKLPVPMVTAEDSGVNAAVVRWNFQRSAEPLYRLIVNSVNVVGSKFKKNVASDLRYTMSRPFIRTFTTFVSVAIMFFLLNMFICAYLGFLTKHR